MFSKNRAYVSPAYVDEVRIHDNSCTRLKEIQEVLIQDPRRFIYLVILVNNFHYHLSDSITPIFMTKYTESVVTIT